MGIAFAHAVTKPWREPTVLVIGDRMGRFDPRRVERTQILPALEYGVAQIPMRFCSQGGIFVLSVWAWALSFRFAVDVRAAISAESNARAQAFELCVAPFAAGIVKSVGVAGTLARMGASGIRGHLRPFFDLALTQAGLLPPQHLSFSPHIFHSLLLQFPFFDTQREAALNVEGRAEIRALSYAGMLMQAYTYERLTGVAVPGQQLPRSMSDISDIVDVFMSYSHEDAIIANALCAALERRGRTVFIDSRLHGSGSFNLELTSCANTARVVLAIWSAHSIASRWVQAEAMLGFDTHRLVNVLIADVILPLPFNAVRGHLIGCGSRISDSEISAIDTSIATVLRGLRAQ